MFVFVWDCGDMMYLVLSVMIFKDFASYVEVVVASTRGEVGDEDYDIVYYV